MNNFGNLPKNLPTVNAYRRSPLTLYVHFEAGIIPPVVTVRLTDENGVELSALLLPTISALGQLASLAWTTAQVTALPDYVKVEIRHDDVPKLITRLTPTNTPDHANQSYVLSEGVEWRVYVNDSDVVRQAKLYADQAGLATPAAAIATAQADRAFGEANRAFQEAGVAEDHADAAIAAKNIIVPLAQQVASDAQAVDLAATQVETKRQQVSTNALAVQTAKNNFEALFPNAQAITDAVTVSTQKALISTDKATAANESAILAGLTVVRSATQTLGKVSSVMAFLGQDKETRIKFHSTSIGAISISPLQTFWAELVRKYGSSGTKTFNMGIGGGSYGGPWKGWKKQQYAGYTYFRIAGETGTAQPLVFSDYVKSVVIGYSKEDGGGDFEVWVDDVYDSTVSCAGTQAYGQEKVITFSTLAMRKIEIRKTGSGKAYLERIDMRRDERGIRIIDCAMHGRSVNGFFIVGATAPSHEPTIQPINTDPSFYTGTDPNLLSARLGNTGIDSVLVNPAANFQHDFLILASIVNDAGGIVATDTGYYRRAHDRIIDRQIEEGKQTLIIIEPGGHFSMPAHPNYAHFQALRNILLSYDGRLGVTVLDWHSLMGLQTTDPVILARLAAEFYTVNNLNVALGTYDTNTSDFIHPNNKGYAILLEALGKLFNIDIRGLQGRAGSEMMSRATATAPLVTKLIDLNSRKLVGMNGLRFLAKNTFQIENSYELFSSSKDFLADVEVPLFRCVSEINFMRDVNSLVDASTTSDEYGKFITGQRVYYSYQYNYNGNNAKGMTLTLIVGEGAWSAVVKNRANTAYLPVIINGQSFTPYENLVGNNQTGGPQVRHFVIAPFSGGAFVVTTGKIYAGYLTPTTFPCIPGRDVDTRRSINVPIPPLTDLTVDQIIQGQMYSQVVNGKTIEMVATEGRVWKPLLPDVVQPAPPAPPLPPADKWRGLYRLREKAGTDIRTLVMNNGAVGPYNAKFGGATYTGDGLFRLPGAAKMNAAGHAEKIYTVTGYIADLHPFAGVYIYLKNGGSELRLALDGTWTTQAVAVVDVAGAFHSSGMPLAFTFTLPTAAQFGAGDWDFIVGSPYCTAMGSWVLCEGRSACV